MAKRDIQEIMNEVQGLRENIRNKSVEELRIILDNLKKLMEESDYDEGVAIEYAKSFHWLIMKQNFEGKKESVLVLEALMDKFPDSVEIAIKYGQGLLNLVKETSLKENELILKEFQKLEYKFYDNEEINIQYAKALLMVLNDSDLEEKKEVIEKLENLKEKDSSIDDITYRYAEALKDSIYYGDLALAEESSNKLDELLYVDREDDEVIARFYADSLAELLKLQNSEDDLSLSMKELEEIFEKFEEDDNIVGSYAEGLLNRFRNRKSEDKTGIIDKLAGIIQTHEHNETVAKVYSEAIIFQMPVVNMDVMKQSIEILDDMFQRFNQNKEIAINYSKALVIIISEEDLNEKDEDEYLKKFTILYERFIDIETVSFNFGKFLSVLSDKRSLDGKKDISEFTERIKVFLNNNSVENGYLGKNNEEKLSKKFKDIFDGRTAPVNSTATSKDYLNREHISNAISLYIKAKKESISTIGIFSTWGNGKSSFIKNILEKLKEEPSENEVEIVPIEIDAVFSDDCEKIWIIIYKKLIEEYKNQIDITINQSIFLSLIIIIISGLLSVFLPKILFLYLITVNIATILNELNFPIYLKVYDFLLEGIVYLNLFYKPWIIFILNLFLFFMLKNDIINYTEEVKFANLEINKVSLIAGIISFIWIFCDFTKNIVSVLNKESFISAYKHEEKLGFKSVIHEKINNVIEKIINGKDRKILIIVDELDRSSLDKINEIIESTHILLNNNNLMFLFSVNPRQIGKALLLKEEEFLGNEIDIYKHGRHYMEKYMDIYLYLPFPKDYSRLLDNIIDEQLEEKVIKDPSNVPTKSSTSSPTSSPSKIPRNSSNNSTIPDNNKIKEIMKFPKDEKQEIKTTINKITEYSNLTPRKVKTIITLSTLSVQIFNSRRGGTIRKERLSLMKFILITLGLLDFMDMSEILKEKNSVYTKFLEKIVLKTGEEDKDKLVKDIDMYVIDSYGKEYLSLFAEKLDFN